MEDLYPSSDYKLISRVWVVMQNHVGFLARIGRRRLVNIVMHRWSESNDRKIRDALSELPVIWDRGYFIPANEKEAEGYVAAMRSRQASIGRRLKVLDNHFVGQKLREEATVQLELGME